MYRNAIAVGCELHAADMLTTFPTCSGYIAAAASDNIPPIEAPTAACSLSIPR
jgi:hypothetical protein